MESWVDGYRIKRIARPRKLAADERRLTRIKYSLGTANGHEYEVISNQCLSNQFYGQTSLITGLLITDYSGWGEYPPGAYLTTLTGVPTFTAAKNRLAFEPGILMQPCEAG